MTEEGHTRTTVEIKNLPMVKAFVAVRELKLKEFINRAITNEMKRTRENDRSEEQD